MTIMDRSSSSLSDNLENFKNKGQCNFENMGAYSNYHN